MTNPPAPVLQATGLTFAWKGQPEPCLQIDTLTLQGGEQMLLLGPSGGGKSTLLGLLGGVLQPTQGEVQLLGQTFSGLRASARDRLRANHVGFIFQQFNLVPYLSLEDNVLLPCHFSAVRRQRAGSNPRATARELLQALELPADAWQRPVTGLSVGQQQRAAAARALIGHPELLIADEPTSALDSINRDRLMQLLMAQLKKTGGTLLVVSHDEQLRPHFGRVLQLADINRVSGATRPADPGSLLPAGAMSASVRE